MGRFIGTATATKTLLAVTAATTIFTGTPTRPQGKYI